MAEQGHSRPADAIAASSAMLADALAARGQSYEEFLWTLAGAKVAA